MEVITDRQTLAAYLTRYTIQEHFSFDIEPYLKLVKFNAEEYIVSENLLLTHLYYMVEGVAKLYKSHKNGKVSLIAHLKAPCFIGEMEILDILDLPKSMQAQTTCIAFQLPFTECKQLLMNDIKFLRHICSFLGKKAIHNMQVSTRNQVYPLANRLADFILLTAHNGVYTERHTEASEFLGVTYRHLLYVLARFCKDGILKKTPQGYVICEESQLEALAAQL